MLTSTFVVSSPVQDGLTEARRLRDSGNFSAAIEVLRTQLAQHPDDGEAARLLAQTLYWNKDIANAREAYESAAARHPEDTTLRIQYARMLVETGEESRARELLIPLTEIDVVQAEAETLLGTLSYWKGDLTSAQRRFIHALEFNPNQEDARRQLREIRTVTASWFRVSTNGWHDNQPFNRVAFAMEAGWFATPLTELTIRVQPKRYELGSTSRTVGIAEAGIKRFTPALRLDTELAAGAIRRPKGTWDWTGRAALGFRIPAHLTLGARAERTPYLSTMSSLETRVMVRSVAGVLHWGEVRGWTGEAAYERQHFPDGNSIRSAYGWFLAPLIMRTPFALQAGYSAAGSNAASSRFVLKHASQPYAPGHPLFDTAGHYEPYYTPNHLAAHSVIIALKAKVTRNAAFRIGGAYAVRSTDDAPFFYVSSGQAVLDTYSRRFSPWDLRASLQIAAGNLMIEPTASFGHSPFYSWSTAGLQITHRRAARDFSSTRIP